MNDIEVKKKVIECIAENIGCDIEECKDDTNLHNDLGYDSLDQVTLIMLLEDEFDIEIPDESMDTSITVKSVVKYIVNSVKKETI